MGKRGRKRSGGVGGSAPTEHPRRSTDPGIKAPSSAYTDADGNELELRGSLTPKARAEYAATLGGGLDREDAWQRATELLFERLALSWTVSGVRTDTSEGAARPLPDGRRAGAPLRARQPAHAPRGELPGAAAAVIDADAFAVLVADWCLEVQRGQQVLIDTTTLALEPAVALHRALLEREAWPLLRLSPGGLEADFFRHARDLHLDDVAPIQLAEYEAADASVRISAPANMNAVAGIDPLLVARRARAEERLRAARARRRWCVTIWPTPALAQRAGMDERGVRRFRRAGAVPRPARSGRGLGRVARPAGAGDRAARSRAGDPHRDGRHRPAAERRGPDMDQLGRAPQHAERRGLHGAPRTLCHRCHPLRRALEPARSARWRASSSGSRRVRWWRRARTSATSTCRRRSASTRARGSWASSGSAPTPASTARQVRRCSTRRSPGTVHLALGNSYPETGGSNESALHWDLICDLRKGGRVTVDGDVVIQDGVLVQ